MDAGAAIFETAVLPQRPSVKTVELFAKKWRLTTWGLVLIVSSFVGLFFAAQMHYSSTAFGRPVSWGQALYWALGDWYEWAILSPLIFWVSRRFSFERNRWRKSLGIHFVAGVILSVVHLLLCGMAEQLQAVVEGNRITFGTSFQRLFTNRFHFNLAVYGLIVCAWHAWDYYRKYREREAHAAQLAGRLAQAQLQALRMQLNPHFLFNTLHAVSSLMLTDVVAANRMIARLGEFLRSTLENTDQQEVPLKEELDFLRRYLEIEEIRFGERLAVRMKVEPGTLDAMVPNLILQPLVENAIRYAIEPNEGPGEIEISASRNNGEVILQVSDSGGGTGREENSPKDSRIEPLKLGRKKTPHPGPLPLGRGEGESFAANSRRVPEEGSKPDDSGVTREGVGLSNTRQRLRQLYGRNQKLELKRLDSGGLQLLISVPFRAKTDQERARPTAYLRENPRSDCR